MKFSKSSLLAASFLSMSLASSALAAEAVVAHPPAAHAASSHAVATNEHPSTTSDAAPVSHDVKAENASAQQDHSKSAQDAHTASPSVTTEAAPKKPLTQDEKAAYVTKLRGKVVGRASTEPQTVNRIASLVTESDDVDKDAVKLFWKLLDNAEELEAADNVPYGTITLQWKAGTDLSKSLSVLNDIGYPAAIEESFEADKPSSPALIYKNEVSLDVVNSLSIKKNTPEEQKTELGKETVTKGVSLTEEWKNNKLVLHVSKSDFDLTEGHLEPHAMELPDSKLINTKLELDLPVGQTKIVYHKFNGKSGVILVVTNLGK